MTTIMEDKRKIKHLILNDGKSVTGYPYHRIIPYHENGEMASVIWFEVRHQNGHDQKINGKYVRQIFYYKED